MNPQFEVISCNVGLILRLEESHAAAGIRTRCGSALYDFSGVYKVWKSPRELEIYFLLNAQFKVISCTVGCY